MPPFKAKRFQRASARGERGNEGLCARGFDGVVEVEVVAGCGRDADGEGAVIARGLEGDGRAELRCR